MQSVVLYTIAQSLTNSGFELFVKQHVWHV